MMDKSTLYAITFLAAHAFYKPASREGLDGASDEVLIYEDEEHDVLWVFDPKAEGGPRLEAFTESCTQTFWIFSKIDEQTE